MIGRYTAMIILKPIKWIITTQFFGFCISYVAYKHLWNHWDCCCPSDLRNNKNPPWTPMSINARAWDLHQTMTSSSQMEPHKVTMNGSGSLQCTPLEYWHTSVHYTTWIASLQSFEHIFNWISITSAHHIHTRISLFSSHSPGPQTLPLVAMLKPFLLIYVALELLARYLEKIKVKWLGQQ